MGELEEKAAEPELPTIVEVPDGRRLTVRGMVATDVDGIELLYEALSAEDRYRRFFSSFHAPRSFVAGWIHRIRQRGFGVVAVLEDGGPAARLVAEAGYVLLPNGDGEFAITIAADWRGWLGPYLLDVLVAAARARGVPNLEADILTDNRTMRALVRHRGYVTLDDSEFNVVRVAIAGAGGSQPTWPATPGRRRLLVEAPGGRWAHSRDARRDGFEVLGCEGPDKRCPVLQGRPCPLVAAADLIIVALPPSDERTQVLLTGLARLHPDVPIVVQSSSRDRLEGATGCQLAAGSTAAEAMATLHQALEECAPG